MARFLLPSVVLLLACVSPTLIQGQEPSASPAMAPVYDSPGAMISPPAPDSPPDLPPAPVPDCLQTVIDKLDSEDQYSALIAALKVSGTALQKYVNCDEPITLLAPNNEAFALLQGVTPAERERLNKGSFEAIILYHVLMGYYPEARLKISSVTAYSTFYEYENVPLPLLGVVTDSGVFLGPATIPNNQVAELVDPDVYLLDSKVAVQGINAVLIPPGLPLAPPKPSPPMMYPVEGGPPPMPPMAEGPGPAPRPGPALAPGPGAGAPEPTPAAGGAADGRAPTTSAFLAAGITAAVVALSFL